MHIAEKESEKEHEQLALLLSCYDTSSGVIIYHQKAAQGLQESGYRSIRDSTVFQIISAIQFSFLI